MSLLQNDEWLEAAYEHFQEALERKDWGFAEAVVEDVKHEGFTSAAKVMRFEFLKAQKGTKDAIEQFENEYVG